MKDELLIEFLLNETDAERTAEVQQWLDADPANRAYFSQFELIWNTSKNLAAQSTVDEEVAWMEFKKKVNKKPAVKKLNFTWMKVAATLLLIASTWLLYNTYGPQRYTELYANENILTKTLPDGSVITLNKHSNLSYASNFKGNRSVRLDQGEVFFKVTPNKEEPFIIEAEQVSVKVVGTSFNVKHTKNLTEVIVETGIVQVSKNNETVELRQGEKVSIGSTSGKLIKQRNSDQLYNFYQSKVLIANNTPLSKIIAVLNQTYNSNISFKNNEISKLTLTTTFREKSLNDILTIICETHNLEMTRNQNQILLSYK